MSEAIPDEWISIDFGELATKIEGGGTPSRAVSEYWHGNIPWATVKDLTDTYLCSTEEAITELGLKESSSKLIPKDTVIISTRMAVGKAVVFNRDVAINQDLKAIYPKINVDWRFLLQWYLSKSSYIEAMGTGSTVKGIRLDDLKVIPIDLPPKPEQQKIASILTSVDEVIEKTKAQISKLQDLKKGMMQELLTKGIGHTEFKDSPVGRIPKGWDVATLGDVAVSNGLQTGPFGSQLHAHEYVEHGIPVIMPRDLRELTVSTSEIAYISDEKAAELKRHRVEVGDILFGRRGDIGRCALIRGENAGWICGTGCLKARLGQRLLPDYLIYYLTLPSVVEWLNNNAVGQTMLNLNTSILASLPIVLPPKKEQRLIADSMDSVVHRYSSKWQKYSHLIRLKKSLMQDLLTGKVRVKVS